MARKQSVTSKAKKASRLGRMRSAQIKRLISIDSRLDKLRAKYEKQADKLRTVHRSVEARIAAIDYNINLLGYGG